jgi:hypothetical protein
VDKPGFRDDRLELHLGETGVPQRAGPQFGRRRMLLPDAQPIATRMPVTRTRPAAAARSGGRLAALGTLISRPPSRRTGREAMPAAPLTRSRTTSMPATSSATFVLV